MQQIENIGNSKIHKLLLCENFFDCLKNCKKKKRKKIRSKNSNIMLHTWFLVTVKRLKKD